MIGRMAFSLALVFAVASPVLAIASSDSVTETQTKPTLEVIMYSTKTCGYCEKARQWFTSHKVAWDERDIETSATAQKEWRELGGVGTPLIIVNGKPFSGFVEGALETEIGKYR